MLKRYISDTTERRTQYALANALRPKREGTLFEHFLVIGVPSNISTKKITPKHPQKLEPKVLFQYPSKPLSIEYVAHFAFPHSIEVSAIPKTQSASGFHEVLFGQLSRVEQSEHSFIFLATAEDHLLYGICVSNVELVSDYSSFVKPVEEVLVNRPQFDYVAPRCYCFLSKFPFFRLHFEVLYSIIARERLAKIARAVGVTDEQLKLEKASEALDLLSAYYEKQVPNAENRALKFNLPGELRSIEFVCPPGDEDKHIAEWTIATTFTKISLDHIIDLFRATMLEKSIVIVCSNLGLLSAVALSIIPVLRPYVFQGPFIPILPEILHEYLEAPVPFIIGVQKLPSNPDLLERLQKEKVILYVENDQISFPEGVPQLPQQKQLYSSLKTPYKTLREKSKRSITIRNQDDYLELIQSIIQSFKSYHAWLMDDVIIKNIKLENNTFDWGDLNKLNQLVSSMEASYREFMLVFVSSQMFNIYGEKLLEIIQAKPKLIKTHNVKKKNLSLGDFRLSNIMAPMGVTLSNPQELI